MISPSRMSAGLGLGVLLTVVVAPPEAYGSGRMLLVVMATFALLIMIADSFIPTSYLAGGAIIWSLLLAHSLFLSFDPYRSIEFLCLLWAYYCLYGVFRYSPVDLRTPACLVLVVAATGVSLYGLYQFIWGFDELYALVADSQANDAIRVPLLDRIASQRVFATFALPGTLWGFLILSLPLHVALWTNRSRLKQALLVASGALVLGVSALTQSYGFVLGALVALGGWMLTRPGRVSLPRAAIGCLVACPLLGTVVLALYVARAGTHNPVWLRVQNWLSAWEMFAANPMGSGLNSYGVLYLQHQQPGANETQFAHNTPLQLMAELGVFGFVAVLAGAVWILSRTDRLTRITGIRRYLLIGLMVWAVHNLIDINVYFGSVGALGAALAGLFMWSPTARHADDTGPTSAFRRWATGATGVLATLVLATSGVIFVSGEYLVRARTDLEFLRVSDASVTLGTAARINPFDSSIMYEAGQTELGLYHASYDTERLEASQEYFRRAIRLSPRKAGPHIGLALALASEDRTGEATDELEIAQTLHPAGTQASNIRRLIGKRPTDSPVDSAAE